MKIYKVLFRACLVVLLTVSVVTGFGTTRFQNKPARTVKLGLLIPDNKSIAAKQGAELAIKFANEKGGFNGRPFELITRSMEGPWGTGSKQAVNLIFNEEVWAIMGSHDGRNAHLVEQVSAKTRTLLLSAWAGDPTLSQAFVPWYFSCVPNDLQQASVMIEEIYNKSKTNRVAVIYDDDYDSNSGVESFLKRIKASGKPDPIKFLYENYSQNISNMLDQIRKTGINAIVLFCQPSASFKILQQIRQRKMNQPVFCSLQLLDENKLTGEELRTFENIMLFPSGNWSVSKSSAFRQEFQKTYQKSPGMVAAYAFDGMNLLIDAIRKAGLDRDKIQKSLAKINYEGITGPIQFDDKGNRSGTFDLKNIINGLPVAAK